MVHLTDLQSKVMEYILQAIDETGMPPTLREIAAYFGWKAVGSAQDVVTALRKKGVLLPPTPGKSRQLVPAPAATQMLSLRHGKYLDRNAVPSPLLPSASSMTFEDAAQAKDITARRTPVHGARTIGVAAKALVQERPDERYLAPHCMLVPVLGLVQAGNPREAIESAMDRVPFMNVSPRSDSTPYFAVIVEGYSMMNVGFLPGDYLLVESSATAKNGDVVLAALEDHEVTVKRFAMRGSHLYRQAYEQLSARKMSLEKMPPALLVPENPDFEPLPFGLADSDKVIGLVRSLYRKDVM